MNIEICANYQIGKEILDVVLHVTHFDYSPGYPGSGPSYSCGGTPPEPAEAIPTEGWVELDCCPCEDKERMDKILLEDNAFEKMIESEDEELQELITNTLLEYQEELDSFWESNLEEEYYE